MEIKIMLKFDEQKQLDSVNGALALRGVDPDAVSDKAVCKEIRQLPRHADQCGYAHRQGVRRHRGDRQYPRHRRCDRRRQGVDSPHRGARRQGRGRQGHDRCENRGRQAHSKVKIFYY